MIYPKFLKSGDTIGVPAPSSGAYDDPHCYKYKNSRKKLEEMGYKIEWSENVFKSVMARSADAETRAKELNYMFESNEINFIMCAAGGEFIDEILPYVEFERIAQNPKWVQGFSDPQGILFPITTKYDIATLYGLNFGDYGTEPYTRDITDNLKIITGNLIKQDNYDMYENERGETVTGLEPFNFTDKVIWKNLNRENVDVTGRIIGGNLDVILELCGTKYDGTKDFVARYKDDGIIWYFDNCELSKEDLIRAMWRLNEFGYFENTKAIIFGRNGNDKESYLGYTMETALKDSIVAKKDIPIVYDADVSHKGPCMTIINGSIATVESKDGKGSIRFELK
ncbi:MAG: LD-carboxypeptidase [Clostridia bacterium]|nr:LD-carboxypeptidase [Clostridia bacterium]